MFWNILNRFWKKKFQKFWSKIFTKWPFWPKNGRVPEKNFQRVKFFEIDFFGLEYVLRHSESIRKKNSKILVENFHFRSFLTIFDSFWPFLKFLGQKMKKKFHPILRNFIAVILSHHWGLYDLRFGRAHQMSWLHHFPVLQIHWLY